MFTVLSQLLLQGKRKKGMTRDVFIESLKQAFSIRLAQTSECRRAFGDVPSQALVAVYEHVFKVRISGRRRRAGPARHGRPTRRCVMYRD
jgi:hypothetical protein